MSLHKAHFDGKASSITWEECWAVLKEEKPGKVFQWAVVWHVNDHAEGQAVSSEEARAFYKQVSQEWAKQLYDHNGKVLEEYGHMGDDAWNMLEVKAS